MIKRMMAAAVRATTTAVKATATSVAATGSVIVNFVNGQVLTGSQLNAIQTGKVDVISGSASGLAITAGTVDPTSVMKAITGNTVSVDAILLDAHALRRAGCKLDGVTDDGPAINTLIANIGTTVVTGMPAPTVAMQLPAGTVLFIGTTLQTGTVSLSISGGGKDNTVILMKSGGAGVIQHGTTSTPAVGTLQIRDIAFVDADILGSGSPAISAVFSSDLSLFGCLAWLNVFFRYFSQALNATNVPRDTVWFNVKAAGPDGAVQALSAFQFTGTTANTFGNFNGLFIQCAGANYSYVWQYSSNVPWEGQRFYSCDGYNGWGLVKVWISPTAISGVTNYQAVGWLFNGCDWQGYGFALDMCGCRMIRIDNFYCAVNALPSGTAIPAAPDGTTRSYRSLMSFRRCGDVEMNGSNFESGGNLDSTSTVVFVNSDVSYFRSSRARILVGEQVAGGFEYASGNSNNVCAALDTYWAEWGGNAGTCVLDHGANQTNQEAVFYANADITVGEVSYTGRYRVVQTAQNVSMDSNHRVAVTFPTRWGTTNPIFIGGAPHLQWDILGQDTTAGVAYLYDITSTGFTIQFANASTATLGIEYTAEGF
ncbi:hypothetical protein [Tanticharoenia sakaeratensis]|uniref:Tail fiber protein n=1 Tax=Tanticharoenia sakaeratensis NBRC 103193 TaxID=1231623 RepID=A0A0D6MMJ3_9PROT|nr:hypothetical protein [Tanticharoenia sakaeratensis]GAN54889.1 hypothetical protein Tasa_033_003 [Tanticharoenia sakaeratensis NBRC 103193]GBQ23456.1 hypothetical protein AA103193_2421 [Tanticharoenia sakaeratensis NBRC 103193]